MSGGTPPDSFGRRRLGLHGALLLGPPVVQPDGDRVRHDDVVRRRIGSRRSLLGRGPRGQPLRRDHQRVGRDPRERGDGGGGGRGGSVAAEARREVDALVLRRRGQDEAAAVARPAAGAALADAPADLPGERLRLGSVLVGCRKAKNYFIITD